MRPARLQPSGEMKMTEQLDVTATLNDALAKFAKDHGWKEITIHKDCGMFPMMPEDELRQTAQDISAHGLRESVTIKSNGKSGVLWDGRNRFVACAMANVTPLWTSPPKGVTAHDFIVSANIMRRHLTTEQRAALAAKLLKVNPAKSDRAVAKQVKLSPPTIAKIRKKEERRENILHVEKHTDSKGRKQPASG